MKARVKTLALLCAAVPSALAWHGSARAQAPASPEAAACIARSNIDRVQIIDSRRIMFSTRDRQLFRNDLAKACPALRQNSQVNYSSSNNQLCSGSPFQIMVRVSTSGNTTSVFDRATGTSTAVEGPGLIGGPVCTLGAFTPIGAEEAAALIIEAQKPPPSRRERRAAREAEENDE
jgi:hypothetical protein